MDATQKIQNGEPATTGSEKNEDFEGYTNYKCRSCGTEFTHGDGNRETAEAMGWEFDLNDIEPLCYHCIQTGLQRAKDFESGLVE